MAGSSESFRHIFESAPDHRGSSPRFRLKSKRKGLQPIIVDVHGVIKDNNPNVEKIIPHEQKQSK